MLKHFLNWMLFAFTMFAAAPVDLGGGDGGGDGSANDGGLGEDAGGGDPGEDPGGDDGLGSDRQGDDEGLGDLDPEAAEGEGERPRERQQVEDPETAGFKGLVSRRILALKKEAPGLTEIFKEHPKVQEQIEAAFRRDMGYRELGTIADFRSFREEFPGGMPDVQELRSDIAEMEQVDRAFDGRDPQGNYAGHPQLIQNFFQRDRAAAVSLFRTLPKEWARLDPESYNEVMGNIVGATLARSEVPEWLGELQQAATAAKQDGLAAQLGKLLRWSQGFMKQKAAPSEEERRLQGQREQFQRETAEQTKQNFTRFSTDFNVQSRQLQVGIIRKHPAIAQLLTTKALPEAKKTAIIEEIRTGIVNHLKQSSAFTNKLRPLYQAGKMKEALDVQRVSWSYPWILNKFVRAVLAKETPALVEQNRARRRGGTPAPRPPANRNQNQNQNRARTEPYKEGGQWYSKEGRRLSTSEILRGAVPDALLNSK